MKMDRSTYVMQKQEYRSTNNGIKVIDAMGKGIDMDSLCTTRVEIGTVLNEQETGLFRD